MTTKRRFWAEFEIAELRRRYPNEPTAAIAADLGRSERAVYAMASLLGLRKSDAYLCSAGSSRFRPGSTAGAATRIKPGSRPWNAGLKGYNPGGRSVDTRFKPGGRGTRYRQVGSERVSVDGYLQRKVSDTGGDRGFGIWRAVHVLVWEETNGPIPDGHVVAFRDGNRCNLKIGNLELISRAEMIARNTIHRYPEELKEVIRLAGKLRRAIDEEQD